MRLFLRLEYEQKSCVKLSHIIKSSLQNNILLSISGLSKFMSEANNIIIEVADSIMQIQLHRPEKKNTLTRAMYAEINAALIRAEQDRQIRVIVLTGSSDCFSAGNDIADFLDNSAADIEQPMLDFVRLLPFINKPLVAAVNGIAIGVGVTILLHCDLVYTGKKTQFQLPFVSLGLIPEAGSTMLLPQLVGHRRAAELLLLGETFTAEQAYAMGIVNRICPAESTLQYAMEAAHKIAAQSSTAVQLTKSLLKNNDKDMLRNCIPGSRYFCESLFWASQPKQAAKT
jgi:enoyl-CoA hydratase/carnithine racemase